MGRMPPVMSPYCRQPGGIGRNMHQRLSVKQSSSLEDRIEPKTTALQVFGNFFIPP